MAREKLTALRVERVKVVGKYADGGGLYLQVRKVDNTIAKSWVFRYRFANHVSKKGKPLSREMGLGPLADVSLKQARDEALKCRAQLRERKDPIEARRNAHQQVAIDRAKDRTFKQCAEAYITLHRAGWKNPKHAAQWPSSLEIYAYPVIGDLNVAAVDTALVVQILTPIWTTKTETAGRVRGRIECILDYAKVSGYRSGENPARWKGHLDHLLPARNKVQKVEHHPALPYAQIGEFMVDLRKREAVAARALEFLILTAARSEEVFGARWSEIDGGGMWTVPGERMKGGREHRVPLSPAALKVLEGMELVREGGSDYVFPGGRRDKLSAMAIHMLLRRMNSERKRHGKSQYLDPKQNDRAVVPHGFRSSFRDWAGERSNFSREVAEAALAHVNGDATEAAYLRGEFFEKRRKLMTAWSEFCNKPPAAGNVTPIRKVAR